MARAWQLSDRWKRGAAALLLVLAGGVLSRASPEPQGTPSLEALLGHFAASPGLRAAVEEEKHISLLREPLVSHGTIAFVPPGLLVRVIDEPVSSLLVIDADGLPTSCEPVAGMRRCACRTWTSTASGPRSSTPT